MINIDGEDYYTLQDLKEKNLASKTTVYRLKRSARLDEIIKYCEPHQEYMWAKYIIGLAKAKKDWRDND